MNERTLTSADAVRLARFAYPDGDWVDCETEGGEAMDQQDSRVTRSRYFELCDLNNLAICEQRVAQSGLTSDLAVELVTLVGQTSKATDPQHDPYASFVEAAMFAPAEARARAILAVLDAHPELEKT